MTCSLLYSFGFVDFASAEEAKAVFDSPEGIEVDGHVLFIDFKAPKPAERGKNIHGYIGSLLLRRTH